MGLELHSPTSRKLLEPGALPRPPLSLARERRPISTQNIQEAEYLNWRLANTTAKAAGVHFCWRIGRSSGRTFRRKSGNSRTRIL